MKNFIPKQLIINNPSSVDITRFHLEYIIAEAINIKDNSLEKEHTTLISDDIEIISPDKTRVFYNYRDDEVSITTEIKKEIMEINLKLIKQANSEGR